MKATKIYKAVIGSWGRKAGLSMLDIDLADHESLARLVDLDQQRASRL